MRVLITGSRDWPKAGRALLFEALEEVCYAAYVSGQTVTIVHGAARGADTMAHQWAVWRQRLGWPVAIETHPAQWTKYGKGAGRKRNIDMVMLGADICLAFIKDSSPGASHCASIARRSGIETVVHTWPGHASIVDSPTRITGTETD